VFSDSLINKTLVNIAKLNRCMSCVPIWVRRER